MTGVQTCALPISERKTEDEPHPTYPERPTSKPAESQPAAGSTNSSGQVYVPGFGYVDSSGDNTVIDGQDIYENGNKIGEMGGRQWNDIPRQADLLQKEHGDDFDAILIFMGTNDYNNGVPVGEWYTVVVIVGSHKDENEIGRAHV